MYILISLRYLRVCVCDSKNKKKREKFNRFIVECYKRLEHWHGLLMLVYGLAASFAKQD